MADSESLVDDFFPRLQITADKLMTREGIVSPLFSSLHARYLARISSRERRASSGRVERRTIYRTLLPGR